MANKNKNNSVSITWNQTAGATSYTIYRKKVDILGLDSYKPIASDLITPNYVDKSTVNGANYSYLVTAKNDIGKSEQSSEVLVDNNKTTIQLITLLIGFLILVFLTTFFRIRRDKSKSNTIKGPLNKTA
ncbi:fibronectin type III domain-containing protein [Neobacillus drentensis]|uniref:fibronectin type III domain-containing protein n=1 Tax=Neobacillus drentensis TaxID=220684 RepID=UPI002FFE5666